MRLILQGFLTRLSVLEGQLIELDPEGKQLLLCSSLQSEKAELDSSCKRSDVTFALLLTMKEGTVPSLDLNGDSETGSDSRHVKDVSRQVSATLRLGY